MREDHGVNQPDLACQRAGEGGGDGAEEVCDTRDVAEGGFRGMEFGVEVVVGEGVGDHSVGEGVEREEEPELGHYGEGWAGDVGEAGGEPGE